MTRVPAGLPVLGRGRHRSPKKGGCVMEYASLLAGERWSDAPSCTHPALATLARAVNDCTRDAARQQLMAVVPDVVHALGDEAEDGQIGQRLARKATLAALQVATGVRRRTVMVALLGAELACGPGPLGEPDRDREAVRELLRDPDDALRSAARFVGRSPRPVAYDRTGVETTLRLAVVTIMELGGDRADDLLRELLVNAVAEVRRASSAGAAAPAAPAGPRPFAAVPS